MKRTRSKKSRDTVPLNREKFATGVKTTLLLFTAHRRGKLRCMFREHSPARPTDVCYKKISNCSDISHACLPISQHSQFVQNFNIIIKNLNLYLFREVPT